jgi:RNA polymerase sigma-70 factor (family 1)
MKADLTDAELIEQIKRGDKHAFDFIYQRHWLKLYRVACRITENDIVAQDIIQDTFISFWEKGCERDIQSIEAYLYQTVKFRCFMHLRSGNISKKHLDHFAALIAAQQNQIEEEYALKEMESIINECVSSLPDKCREVYYLSRVEHLSNKKIAEKLHISTKTVENQITKALKQVRLSLDKLAILFAICIS